jgi:hypothetical protein
LSKSDTTKQLKHHLFKVCVFVLVLVEAASTSLFVFIRAQEESPDLVRERRTRRGTSTLRFFIPYTIPFQSFLVSATVSSGKLVGHPERSKPPLMWLLWPTCCSILLWVSVVVLLFIDSNNSVFFYTSQTIHQVLVMLEDRQLPHAFHLFR